MKPQFLSQMIQVWHNHVLIVELHRRRKDLPDSVVQRWKQGVDAVDALIKDVCTAVNEPLISSPTMLKDLAGWPNLKLHFPEMAEFTVEQRSTEVDHEIPESCWKENFRNEDALKQKKREIVSSIEKMMAPPKPSLSDKIGRRNAELVFSESEKHTPLEGIFLYQTIADELFGYGPISPYIRNFKIVEMTEDGSFTADGKVATIEFDSEQHRIETLGLLKLVPKEEVDGTIEFQLSNGMVKFRIPSSQAKLTESLTQIERLGWKTSEDFRKAIDKEALKEWIFGMPGRLFKRR